jgi:hypothetical protein
MSPTPSLRLAFAALGRIAPPLAGRVAHRLYFTAPRFRAPARELATLEGARRLAARSGERAADPARGLAARRGERPPDREVGAPAPPEGERPAPCNRDLPCGR